MKFFMYGLLAMLSTEVFCSEYAFVLSVSGLNENEGRYIKAENSEFTISKCVGNGKYFFITQAYIDEFAKELKINDPLCTQTFTYNLSVCDSQNGQKCTPVTEQQFKFACSEDNGKVKLTYVPNKYNLDLSSIKNNFMQCDTRESLP